MPATRLVLTLHVAFIGLKADGRPAAPGGLLCPGARMANADHRAYAAAGRIFQSD